jgi:transcriptional regulator with XRE-family HTH domain
VEGDIEPVAGKNAVPNFEPTRLRGLRLAASLTQEGLAELAGLPPHTIVQYENGHRAPYATRLAALAAALGVAPSQLTSTEGVETLAQLRINAGLTQQAAANRAGLVRTRYSAIDRGEIATMDDTVAARIAAVFAVTRAQVRTGHALVRASYLVNRD